MKKELKITVLILIILINIFFAYRPHFSNQYPIVGDEFVHIALASYILEGNLPFYNPYLEKEPFHLNLESGFHFMLALLFLLIPGEPVLYYKYFIIIFTIINSLLVFYLTKLYTKNNYAALISTLVFGLIRSTTEFLAHSYFIPLTTGITLLLTALILIYEIENEYRKKYLLLFVINLILMAWFYPPALTFLLVGLIPYLYLKSRRLSEKIGINENKLRNYLSATIILILIGAIALSFLLGGLKYIIFDASWTPVQTELSPVFFFGIIPSLLALLGIFNLIKLKENLILVYLIIISVIQTYIYYVLEFTIFVPFHRLFLFYLVIISILAGYGAINLFNYFKNKKVKKELIIGIILIILIYQVYYTYNLPLLESPKKILDDNLYSSLKYIEVNYPEQLNIATDSVTALSIYPTIGKKTTGIVSSNLGGGYPKMLGEYFTADCNKKENYLKSYKSRSNLKLIIISDKEENCNFSSLIYQDKYYAYEINFSIIN